MKIPCTTNIGRDEDPNTITVQCSADDCKITLHFEDDSWCYISTDEARTLVAEINKHLKWLP